MRLLCKNFLSSNEAGFSLLAAIAGITDRGGRGLEPLFQEKVFDDGASAAAFLPLPKDPFGQRDLETRHVTT